MSWTSPFRWTALPLSLSSKQVVAVLNQRFAKLAGALPLPRYEEQTAKTGTTLTLADPVIVNSDMVVRNGVVLRRDTDYTISGTTITLTTAAVSGDVFLLWYSSGQG